MSLGAEGLLSQDSGVPPLKNTPFRRTKFTVLIFHTCPSPPDLCPQALPHAFPVPSISPQLSGNSSQILFLDLCFEFIKQP